MKKIFKSPIFNIGLLIVIGFVVLYFSIDNDLEGIINSLKNANIQWVYFSLALVLFYYYLGGYLLKMYANLFEPSFTKSQGFVTALIGAFGSGITPAASGGQFFQMMPFRKYGVKGSQTASLLWLDFIIYQVTVIGVVFVLFVLKFTDYFKSGSLIFYLVLFGFVINTVVMGVLLLLYKSNRFHYWMTNTAIIFLERIKIIKNKDASIKRMNAQIEHFHESSDLLEKNGTLLTKAVLLNVFRVLIYYAIPFFVALALRIDIPESALLDIICLTAFVTMVNAFIPVPGASGGTEITFVSIFSQLFSGSVVSLMLMWRFVTFYFIIILGGIVFYFVGQSSADSQGG